MSYIGNAKTPLLLASNVRDDIIPDGTSKVFELSQEVPGGDALNVCVVRRRWLIDVLIQNTSLIQYSQLNATQSQIVINDNYLAAAFSVVAPRTSSLSEDGDCISIVMSDGFETPTFRVDSVSYTRDSITITLAGVVDGTRYFSTGTTVASVSRKYYGPWEILDPETQYEIISTSGFTNRKIEIKDLTPQLNDVLYVLHRGEGTYNFVPSPSSVGPDQLSPNIRNFVVDSESYTTTGEKTLALSQTTPSAKTLVVTVNGVVQVSTNEIKEKTPGILDANNPGTWTLNAASGTAQSITLKSSLFTAASSSNLINVRVLHLTFSTISRRAAFAPTQDPKTIEPGTITNISIISNAISTEKIQDNAITGPKLRLLRDQSLRFQTSPTTETSVISLDQTTGDTQICSASAVQIKSNATTITVNPTEIVPDTTGVVSLGSTTKKFKNVVASGEINAPVVKTNNLEVTGNITITGTIDNTDVSDLRTAVTALDAKVSDIVNFLIPIGTIVPSASVNPPVSTTYGTWLPCDGRTLSRSAYSLLFNALGGASLQSAWPWGTCTSDVFSIPDLRRRLVFGKSGSNSLGANEGIAAESSRSLSHNHTGADHTHTFTHTHAVPGHKHTVVAGASGSLSISTLSGDHTTNISHSHNQTTLRTDNNDSNLNHSHYLTHGHSNGSTSGNFGGDDHVHVGSTNPGTQHRHSLEVTTRNVGSGSFTGRVLGGTGDGTQFMGVEEAHSHTFVTGPAAITHHHVFSIASQTDETGGAIVGGSYNNLYHSHPFSIPTNSLDRTESTSNGQHTHPSTAFSGFIGTSINSPEGNNPIATTSQSTDVTSGASFGANRTGSATLPHIILNYYIRVA